VRRVRNKAEKNMRNNIPCFSCQLSVILLLLIGPHSCFPNAEPDSCCSSRTLSKKKPQFKHFYWHVLIMQGVSLPSFHISIQFTFITFIPTSIHSQPLAYFKDFKKILLFNCHIRIQSTLNIFILFHPVCSLSHSHMYSPPTRTCFTFLSINF
jgi:hypothetical protein